MSTKVEVTRMDIASGSAGSPSFCPVAQALSRALGKSCFVGAVTWSLAESGASFALPPEVHNFIIRYDRGWAVTPFSFEVDA